MINNPNALFKIGLTIKSKSNHNDFKKNFNYIDLVMNSQLNSHAFFKKNMDQNSSASSVWSKYTLKFLFPDK
jgi:hypothetical protein